MYTHAQKWCPSALVLGCRTREAAHVRVSRQRGGIGERAKSGWGRYDRLSSSLRAEAREKA